MVPATRKKLPCKLAVVFDATSSTFVSSTTMSFEPRPGANEMNQTIKKATTPAAVAFMSVLKMRSKLFLAFSKAYKPTIAAIVAIVSIIVFPFPSRLLAETNGYCKRTLDILHNIYYFVNSWLSNNYEKPSFEDGY